MYPNSFNEHTGTAEKGQGEKKNVCSMIYRQSCLSYPQTSQPGAESIGRKEKK